MQVFGDSEHFRPMSMGVKKTVIELANQYSWSQVTTDLKIRYGIDTLKDPALRHLLQQML